MGAYEGKIAVVTGARKGLGRAIAGHLLDQGGGGVELQPAAPIVHMPQADP